MRAPLRWTIPLLVFSLLSIPGRTTAAQGAEQKSSERSFKVSGAVDLDVRTASEDLSVTGGEEGSVRVRCIVQPQNDRDFGDEDVQKAAEYVESHMAVRQEGNRIVIEPISDRGMLRHINVKYEVTTPTNSRVTFETGSGDLNVEGIQGPVESSSGSGDVRVRAVKDGITIHTSSGDVQLEEVGKGPIEASAQSGDVTVQLDSKTGYNLTAHTGSGDLSIASDLTLDAGDTRNEIHGKVRGGGSTVLIRTGSGDIRVE